MKKLSSLLIGMIFGLGITISGMANPAKVLNFFDVAGTWDASLAFVMGGALIVAAIGYAFTFKTRTAPIFGERFHVPTSRKIDVPLVAGSAAFGIGWGLSGFCPGGVIPTIGLGNVDALIFIAAMVIGMIAARTWLMTRIRNPVSNPI